MEKIVSRREFIQHTSKYLKEMPVVITRRGEPDLRLDIYRENISVWFDGSDSKIDFNLVYACGCKRAEDKKLCSKHNRA